MASGFHWGTSRKYKSFPLMWVGDGGQKDLKVEVSPGLSIAAIKCSTVELKKCVLRKWTPQE